MVIEVSVVVAASRIDEEDHCRFLEDSSRNPPILITAFAESVNAFADSKVKAKCNGGFKEWLVAR